MLQGIPSIMVARGSVSATVGYYRTLTTTNAQVPADQSNFPVLVDITDATLKTIGNGGHVRSSSGFDILFYSDSGKTTKLKWEMDFYDPATGHVVAHVKIASLTSGSANVFYMFYGNASDTADQSDAVNTWDANYLGVWHLKDGTTLSLVDSTTITGTMTNIATVGATSGQINGAAGSFNGTSQAIKTPNQVDYTAQTTATFSMWCDWTAYANNDALMMELSINFNTNGGVLINPNSSATTHFDVVAKGNSGGFNGGWFARPASGMTYFVFTVDTSLGAALEVAAYVNGVSQSITQTSSGNNTGKGIGSAGTGDRIHFMSRAGTSLFGAGKLDEIRFSNIVRSANWITAEYNNQKTGSTFLTLGSETPV